MPLLPLDRAPLTALRQALADQHTRLDAARVDLALARTQLAQARAQGQAEHRQQALREAVAQGEAALQEADAGRRGLLDGIRAQAEHLRVGDDWDAMAQALRGDVPVALLPLRLETRHLSDAEGGGPRLAVRIYPDTVHTLRHLRGLTEAERRGGQDYWAAQAQGEGGHEAVWRRLVGAYRAPRAEFIVRATDPAAGDGPQAASHLARQTLATLLPERFCAVGYAAGRREVFRVWAEHRVPDALPMGPELDPALATRAEAAGALFGPERAWMFDFDAAVAAGMAIVVTPEHVRRRLRARHDPLPFDLANAPLERLVVLGLDWTLDEAQGAEALEAQLEAHAHSHGLACVPLGTATNNTGRGASALNTGTVPAAPTPAADAGADAAAPAAGGTDALDLLRRAFGLPGQRLGAEQLPGAGLAEQRTQMHMLNALWRGTFGRYMDELWNVSQVNTEYVSDRAIETARGFAVAWVRPGGPLPLLRIGKQPYGLLPVVAGLQPADATEAGVAKVLGLLRPSWQQSLATVPRVDGQRLDEVRELVQSGPWSQVAQFRNLENPNMSVIVKGISEAYGAVQTGAKGPLVYQLLKAFGVQQQVQVLLQTVVHDVQAHDMGHVPWVQADATDRKKPRAPQLPLDPPFVAQIHAALGLGQGAKAALSAHQDGQSLLQSLLAFSAEEELDRGAVRLVDKALADSAHAPARAQLALSRATPAFVHIAPSAASGAAAAAGAGPGSAFVEVAHSQALASLKIPTVTGGQTVATHLLGQLAAAPALESGPGFLAGSALVEHGLNLSAIWGHLGSVKASLAHLAPLTVGELDTAFRLTLDAFSYRLDAWATGLASKRLEALRQARAQAGLPLGLHLGAWGVVEDLRRDTQPDSLGYTHAPTLTQAVAAALLRSGFLANAARGGEAFNIDLSSARVQKARGLVEGVARGQGPAALLGYRFERALRDTPDFAGAQYILDYRLRYPLRPAGEAPADQPQERIAARDVVDGLALLEAWQQGPQATVLAVAAAADRPAVRRVLDELADTWDAVSDLMVAESVYQLAQNNLERSAAAAAVLDAHASPVSPQVTQTARSGVSYAQRLVLLCSGRHRWPAWQAAAAADPCSQAEPRLDAWLAGQLGDPARFQFKALRRRVGAGDGPGDGVADAGALDGEVVLGPADLGRGALSLVLGVASAEGPEGAMATPLRRWLVQAFARAVPAEPGLRLDILQRNAEGEPLGLAEFEALAATLHDLVAGAQGLARHDLVVPQDDLEAAADAAGPGAAQGEYPGVDAAELGARAAGALAALDAAAAALQTAGPDTAAIGAALQACWPFGLREAEPEPEPPQADAADAAARWADGQRARRDRVLLEIAERRAAVAALSPRGRQPAEDREPTAAEAVGIAVDTLKQVFGRAFPVLPGFTLGPYAAAVAASLADRAALCGPDAHTVAGWLPQLARVREGADRLDAALSAHEALHGDAAAAGVGDIGGMADGAGGGGGADGPPQGLAVWQCPHVAGRAWAARPEAWVLPPPGPDGKTPSVRDLVPQLAVVAAGADALGGLDTDTLLAGLRVDEWQEAVPDRVQTTGLAFHCDAPGARPPQSLLLAVPPQLEMAEWRFDQLLDTVHEAMDLARLRCVRPKDLVNGLGALLPGNFLPQHPGTEVPGVALWQMARKFAVLADKSVALGKI